MWYGNCGLTQVMLSFLIHYQYYSSSICMRASSSKKRNYYIQSQNKRNQEKKLPSTSCIVKLMLCDPRSGYHVSALVLLYMKINLAQKSVLTNWFFSHPMHLCPSQRLVFARGEDYQIIYASISRQTAYNDVPPIHRKVEQSSVGS